MLIPLIWFLVFLGSMLGLTREQTEGKWVYLAEYQVGNIAGTACSPHVGAKLCENIPGNNTAVLYPAAWYNDDLTVWGHVLRHEVEHLLRAEGSVPGSTYNEKEVAEVACRDAYVSWYCEQVE